MSYQADPVNKDIVISGFANGIAPDPYSGPSDMKSVGLESVPNEVSVAFNTSKISAASIGNVSVTSASTVANTISFTSTLNLETDMAVVFSTTSIGGTTVGNCYWLGTLTINGGTTTCSIYSEWGASGSPVAITSNGTATMKVLNMGVPKYFASDGTNYYCVDDVGNVWGSLFTTASGYWTHTGNGTAQSANDINGHIGNDTSNGNGLQIYGVGSTGAATQELYLFVFSNASVDYMKIATPYSWVYGWNPTTGTINNSAGNSSGFTTPLGINNPHPAIVGPDDNFYYCDSYNVVKIQTTTGQTFNPNDSTLATYTPTTYNLLPKTDVAQCIAPLGTTYLIGGMLNVVYSWDSFSNLASYYILLSENNVKQLVTVNTNTYIFVGNRGRIWITNGSQAQIFKKIPDHISGTIDPLFVWGAATYNWNQLYFGLQAYKNGSLTTLPNYGGLWAIDLTTGALRNVSQMSYGTYSGYCTALFAETSANTTQGYGVLMGWDDGSGNGGIDQSINTPYVGGQSWIATELIPIGLNLNPESPTQIEFKLAKPLVTGESIQLKVGQYLDPSYASFTSCSFDTGVTSFTTTGVISGITKGMPLDKFQWIIVQVILTSTASSPSYVRLVELRLKNAAAPITSFGAIQ